MIDGLFNEDVDNDDNNITTFDDVDNEDASDILYLRKFWINPQKDNFSLFLTLETDDSEELPSFWYQFQHYL